MGNWIGALLAMLIGFSLFLLLGLFWLTGTIINAIETLRRP